MKVKILKCNLEPQYVGKEVEVYCHYKNGIDFVSPNGRVFVPNGDYEIIN